MIHSPNCCNTSDRSVGGEMIQHEHDGYRLIDLVVADDDKRSTRAFCEALGEVAETSVDTAEPIQVQAFAATIRRHASGPVGLVVRPDPHPDAYGSRTALSEANSGSDSPRSNRCGRRRRRVRADRYQDMGRARSRRRRADRLRTNRCARPRRDHRFPRRRALPGVIAGPTWEHPRGLAIPVSEGDVRQGCRSHRTDPRPRQPRCTGGRHPPDPGPYRPRRLCTRAGTSRTDEATRFAKAHHRFGHPLIEHQGVGFKLADIATRFRKPVVSSSTTPATGSTKPRLRGSWSAPRRNSSPPTPRWRPPPMPCKSREPGRPGGQPRRGADEAGEDPPDPPGHQ